MDSILELAFFHLFVARKRRRTPHGLNAIGPVWDGNEVWLLAAGGTLYFAFPLLYASSSAVFIFPSDRARLLMLRGLGVSKAGVTTSIASDVGRNGSGTALRSRQYPAGSLSLAQHLESRAWRELDEQATFSRHVDVVYVQPRSQGILIGLP